MNSTKMYKRTHIKKIRWGTFKFKKINNHNLPVVFLVTILCWLDEMFIERHHYVSYDWFGEEEYINLYADKYSRKSCIGIYVLSWDILNGDIL
jgi:hypothetical protein